MTGPQTVQFGKVVTPLFDENSMTTLLLTLNRRFIDVAPAGLAFPDQVDRIIAAANSADGWIKQLVVAILAERPNNAALAQFMATNPDCQPNLVLAGQHPCDALQLFGGQSFIGRPELRNYLKKMDTPVGRKVLIVLSEFRRVGKSYTKEVVDFLTLNQQGAWCVSADLDRSDYDSGALAKEIGKQIGLDPRDMPPQGDQQAVRWNQELVEWLIPAVPRPAGGTFWFVLDGFRLKLPSEPLKDFIEQLALRVKNTAIYRLVLLNYLSPLPLDVAVFLYKDTVKRLDRAEVGGHLTAIHQLKYGVAPDAPQLTEYLDDVYEQHAQLARDYPESADDTLLLNSAVSLVAESILG